MRVRPATLSDLRYVLDLCNKESKAIGFIPKPAYEAAVTGIKGGHRWSLTCNDRLYVCEENEGEPNPDRVGFVLASFGNIVKVNQIAIQEDARLIERGKALLSSVIQEGEKRGKQDFGCGCADDLESNIFWRAMGWNKTGQRRGIHFSNTYKQVSDRLVNIYRFQLNSLGLETVSKLPEGANDE